MTTTALEAMETAVFTDAVARWRFEQWLKLGFTPPQAEKLAKAKDEHDVYLYPGDAEKRIVEEQLPHWLVYDLLT